jgi:hypothetical protein
LYAQDADIVTRRVQFKQGASSPIIKGTIQGYQTRDYMLGARAGRTMSVKMNTKTRFLYFNVLKNKDQPGAICRVRGSQAPMSGPAN